uniref:Vacuolar protein sorting-associated protein 35 n=1 Tax=Trypanosoma congolense (strain IL3000) TaxID=1068625 RepID=G0UVL3_TRYCI|nr:putative vacuolar protein sorting-associated protein 35 [Trypanosoma congolense IL3000]
MNMHVQRTDPQNVISLQGPILNPQQEQEKWLCDSLETVKEISAEMEVYIQQRDRRKVWDSATRMLDEMRTSNLTPQYYYELYLRVFDTLQVLQRFVEDEAERGCSLEELYDTVQHTGNIVPRLYLLVTVGSVCIKTKEQPVIEVMRDLVEMCKGVQHPTRGLFLRFFLLTMTKNRLPGESGFSGDESGAEEDNAVKDTVELLLQNFKEMNWLWIRMDLKSQQRPVESQRTQQRTHKDRKELCVLVGMNIVRLSQLDGIECNMYDTFILPRLLQIIVDYREAYAQRYLLEVIVQVFPDEFHLFTLDQLLNAVGQVLSRVDVSPVLSALMQRLGKYAEMLNSGVVEVGSSKEKELLMGMFDTLKKSLDGMVDGEYAVKKERRDDNSGDTEKTKQSNTAPTASGRSEVKNILSLHSYVVSMHALVELALKVDPASAPANISLVFTSIAERLPSPLENNVASGVARIVLCIIETLKDPSVVLDIEGLDALVQLLPFDTRRAIAITLCATCLQSPSYRIGTIKLAARFFELVAPLVCDEDDAPKSSKKVSPNLTELAISLVKKYEIGSVEEQQLLCRVLHLLQCDDVGTQAKVMNGVRKQLTKGGPKRIVTTLPTLVSLYMRLALRIFNEANTRAEAAGGEGDGPSLDAGAGEEDASNTGTALQEAKTLCLKIFHFIHSGDGKGILEVLAGEVPRQAFYLYLSSASTADVCGLSEIVYDHFVSAFQLYELSAADMSEQIDMISYVIAQLHAVQSLNEEAYELLSTKVCQYSSKLLRKSDQSRLVALCAHLFWKKSLSEDSSNRVVECLQRSLKIANHVASQQPKQQQQLFVELLNLFLHYYAGRAPGVTARHVTGLLDMVQGIVNEQEQHGEDENEDNCAKNDGSEKSDISASALRFYQNTIDYIYSRKTVDERWKEIGATGEENQPAATE